MGGGWNAGQPHVGVKHVFLQRSHLAHEGPTLHRPRVLRGRRQPDSEKLTHDKRGGSDEGVAAAGVGAGERTPWCLSSQLQGVLARCSFF